MFHMNQNLKVVLAVEPADLRKSFNGLYAIARNELGKIPEDGALFVFSIHTRTRVNNLVENAIRPTAVGKKNWLFFGGANGGQTSAIFYSLLGSCAVLDINSEEYLREVFDFLPFMTNQTAPDWTPAAWKARRNAAKG